MAHALSNLSLSLPLPSMKGASSRNLHGIAFSYNHYHKSNNNMKAMAAESRENLDHLQRARKNPQQSQHKKRVAPAAPIAKGRLPRTAEDSIDAKPNACCDMN